VKVKVSINFGEPGVGGAHRFPRTVAHQPRKCDTEPEENLKFCRPLELAWGDDSNGTKCDSRPGDRPDPLQSLRFVRQGSDRLSAEKPNRSENSSSLLSESTHGIGSTGST